MKVQIDIDPEVWARFRSKVHHQGKTLGAVVPGVVEPALRAYLEPPFLVCKPNEEQKAVIQEAAERGFQPLNGLQYIPPTVRRCELCDMPTERLFASGKYKVCYACWKGALINSNNENNPSTSSGIDESSKRAG